jgi:PAS domain S-box-containing protein
MDTAIESLQHLLDALNCGAAMIDRAGKIISVNARLCAMMQRKCSDLIDANVLDLYTTDDDRATVTRWLEHFDETAEQEFFLPLPDGTHLPIISSARPLPGELPLSDFRVVTMIDIAKQKLAEEALKDQYKHVLEMSDTLLQQALELKRYSNTLELRVRERTSQLHAAHMDAIYMLAVASEAKDADTGRHVRRLEQFSRALALRMGFSEHEADIVGYSAILHDVGKIHVPDDILTKPGPLDDAERARMQEHTLAGERILTANDFFHRARQIARHHHENFDGSGYPDQLAGEQIPLDARIVHLADVFDALTHDRVYKKAWPKSDAIDAIHQNTGTMFDPAVVKAFNAAIQDGSFAQLLHDN